MKKLERSTHDKMVAGVCGGLARYFGVDPTLIRVLAGVLALTSGGTIGVAYLVMWLLVPAEGSHKAVVNDVIDSLQDRNRGGGVSFGQEQKEPTKNPGDLR